MWAFFQIVVFLLKAENNLKVKKELLFENMHQLSTNTTGMWNYYIQYLCTFILHIFNTFTAVLPPGGESVKL